MNTDLKAFSRNRIAVRSLYKLISYLLQPYSFCLLLLGFGIVRLWCKRPDLRRGLRWLVVPLVLLVILSTPAVGYLVIGSLEWQYKPQEDRPKDAEAIVVLDGGGWAPDRGRARAELAPTSLFRTLHAAWVYHQANPCLLVVTGGGKVDPDTPGPPFVDLMAELLIQLGVRSSDLLVDRSSRTTYENAVESGKLLQQRGVRRIVLVTEAIHLPRAVRCFRKQGFEVAPSGCHYRATEFKPSLYQFLPSAEAILANEQAAHEWIGVVWYWVAGRI